MRLVEDPDEVAVHGPAHCRACGEDLAGVPAVRQEPRQVAGTHLWVIPPIQVRVIEHRVETKQCPGCGVETSGAFPAGLEAPIQYGPRVATLGVYLNQEQLLPLERTCAVLNEVCGCPISEGTLERAVAGCHEQLGETEAAIKQEIEAAEVAHFDETGVNIGGSRPGCMWQVRQRSPSTRRMRSGGGQRWTRLACCRHSGVGRCMMAWPPTSSTRRVPMHCATPTICGS